MSHKGLQKAYKNEKFLGSSDARLIRMLAEYLEPASRFRRFRIKDAVVFFGSARVKSLEISQQHYAELQQRQASSPQSVEPHELETAKHALQMSQYYDKARELARLLTEWSITLPGNMRRFVVCSGGGPGMMEAANRGASEAGGLSIGLNISLPFEQDPNRYITPNLAFEFHYFFMRKFWFVYLARGMVVLPGGFGTLDEMMEVLTLVQTTKLKKKIPIVLFGTEFWDEILNFNGLAKWGMISPDDLLLYRRMDDPQEAFEYLRSELTRLYL